MLVTSSEMIPRANFGPETVLLINKITYDNLEAPYSSCLDGLTESGSFDSNFYRETLNRNTSYRQAYCYRLCELAYLKEHCQCELALQLELNGTDNCDYGCLTDAKSKFDPDKNCLQMCPKECDSVAFAIQKEEYPYVEGEQIFENIKMRLYKNRNISTNLTLDVCRGRVFNMRVNFASLTATYFIQVPRTLLSDLISNLGGTTGKLIKSNFCFSMKPKLYLYLRFFPGNEHIKLY